MKKLFFALVCMVGMTIGAYAQDVPAEIKTTINHFRYHCIVEEDSIFECGGVRIEGQDIVVYMLLNENQSERILSIKEAIQTAEDKEDLTRVVREDLFEDMTEDDKQDYAAMYKYKYNLVMRIVGMQSKVVEDVKINYEEFAR